MSKPRICKSCRWLGHRAEPCCSCSRWGKGKTDYYIPAGETLGEYLERKEWEDMGKEKFEKMDNGDLRRTLWFCVSNGNCGICEVKWEEDCRKHLCAVINERFRKLEEELIDERDRYDRLVSFELAEAELLREAKGFVGACVDRVFFTDKANESEKISVFQLLKADCPSSVTCGDSFSPKGRSQSKEVTPPAGGYTSSTADEMTKVNERSVEGDAPYNANICATKRYAEYIAEKQLQTSDAPPDQQAKADAGKPQLCMVPRQIIRDIAEVREYGNRKYGDPENWRTVSVERYRNAAFRHWLAYLDDPAGVDAESGISHLKHLACNIAFLCELENADE